jgi:hypothetical protein
MLAMVLMEKAARTALAIDGMSSAEPPRETTATTLRAKKVSSS